MTHDNNEPSPDRHDGWIGTLQTLLDDRCEAIVVAPHGEVTVEIAPDVWVAVATALRDDAALRFDTLIDLCGVDYLAYGEAEWATDSAAGEGFSRGVTKATAGRFTFDDEPPEHLWEGKRFAVVVHLLSVEHNRRLRLRAWVEDDQFPEIDSLVDVWASANWYEREAFDLFGIAFRGHPDLRRLLTDYGFVGHPFRKDFPLVGHVEMRYDAEQSRVVYEPVTIEPRVLVPRVIRADSRYAKAVAEGD